MKEALQKLIKVKSIVTLLLTLTFVALAATGAVSGDKFFEVFLMVISFYFGTQQRKSEETGIARTE